MSQSALLAAAAIVAKLLHEEWRKNFEKSKGAGAERWKVTKDSAWVTANAGKPYFRSTGTLPEANINIEFDLLPTDWKKDNTDAALAAVPIVDELKSKGVVGDELVEQAADLIHEAWRDRRRPTDGHDSYFQGLDVPYGKLPDDEKEKDRVQARIALSVLA